MIGIAAKKIMIVAVGGKDNWSVVMRRQIARRAIGEGLLRAIITASMKPRNSITSPSSNIHDADALMIDARDPLAPKVRQRPLMTTQMKTASRVRPTNRAGDERKWADPKEWRLW